MNIHDVHRGIKKHKLRKRVGRGVGSGHGKTSGKGHKGQKACAGVSFHPSFEGGQSPLARRIPKRGFFNKFAKSVYAVNVGDLDKVYENGEEVNVETLRAKNLLKGRFDVYKVLGDGELTKKLKVSAHRFSAGAREKITQAGGQVVELAASTGEAAKTE